jgi:hypothetical protein
VLDLSSEAVNPWDQGLEPVLMDLLLEPSDLSAQVAKILGEVFRTRLSWGIGRRTGSQGTVRAVGHLADFPAKLDRVRPAAVLAGASHRVSKSNSYHRMDSRR